MNPSRLLLSAEPGKKKQFLQGLLPDFPAVDQATGKQFDTITCPPNKRSSAVWCYPHSNNMLKKAFPFFQLTLSPSKPSYCANQEMPKLMAHR